MKHSIIRWYIVSIIILTGIPTFSQPFFESHYLFDKDQSIAKGICNATDGGSFVLSLNSHNKFYFISRLTDSGSVVWSKRVGFANALEGDQNYSGNKPVIAATADGGFVIAAANSNIQTSLVKYTAAGDMVWAKVVGRESDDVRAVLVSKDGGYILANFIPNATYSVIIKTDNLGNVQWSKKITRGKSSIGIISPSIAELADGSIIVSGGSGDLQGLAVAKLNQQGELQWLRFGSSQGQITNSASVASKDGGVVLAAEQGLTNPMLAVVKIDASGTVLWSRKVENGPGIDDPSIVELSSGNIIIAGNHTHPGSDNTVYTDSFFCYANLGRG